MLDGGPAANPKPSLAAGAPAIYTTQVPTELIVFNGTPDFVPIVGTALLWASNTTSDVLRDSTSNDYYVLLAGRWFRASALNGQWTSVASNALPPDFAKIPPGSLAGAVLMTVAGTPQAQQALNENSIAQTAQVPRRNGPKFAPKFDGAPQYGPIAGTSLKYVINASAPVIQVATDAYYAVRAGVWFTATQVTGPWTVATSVPEAIYSIPPSSPIYFVTFVRIYDVTPDVVHEGYTPGYLGTTVSPWGTVVYGTGYSYMSWIGNAWYPAPSTYGVAAAPVYNQGAGYTYAFAVGLATPAWTQPYLSGAYFSPGYWGGYPCCGTAATNVYRRPSSAANANVRSANVNSAGPVQMTGAGSRGYDQTPANLAGNPAGTARANAVYASVRRPFRTVGAVAAVFAAQRLLRRPRRQPLSPGQRRLAAAIGRQLGQRVERHDLGRSGGQRAQQQQYAARGGQLRHEQRRPLHRRAEHRLERAGPGRRRLQPHARRQRRHQFGVLQLLERRAGQRRGHVVERRIHLFRRQLVLRRPGLGRPLSLTGTGSSGHGCALAETGVAPFAAVQNLAQIFHGVPDVGESRVQRRDPEAQDVRRAEVADDASRDERLHDCVRAVRVRIADLAAAQPLLARSLQHETPAGTARVDERNEKFGQGQRLCAQCTRCRPATPLRAAYRRRIPARPGRRSAACRT